jgi:hypothetical protein
MFCLCTKDSRSERETERWERRLPAPWREELEPVAIERDDGVSVGERVAARWNFLSAKTPNLDR